MSPRTGVITRMYCVMMCVVLVCQARTLLDNNLRSKILAVLGKNHRAGGASSTSVSANRIQQGLPSSKTKPKATSGGGKIIRSSNPGTSDMINEKETTIGTTTASPPSPPVTSKPLDTQKVDVNININNNINNQDPVKSVTAKPIESTALGKEACKIFCALKKAFGCGCAPSNAWA